MNESYVRSVTTDGTPVQLRLLIIPARQGFYLYAVSFADGLLVDARRWGPYDDRSSALEAFADAQEIAEMTPPELLAGGGFPGPSSGTGGRA